MYYNWCPIYTLYTIYTKTSHLSVFICGTWTLIRLHLLFTLSSPSFLFLISVFSPFLVCIIRERVFLSYFCVSPSIRLQFNTFRNLRSYSFTLLYITRHLWVTYEISSRRISFVNESLSSDPSPTQLSSSRSHQCPLSLRSFTQLYSPHRPLVNSFPCCFDDSGLTPRLHYFFLVLLVGGTGTMVG